MNVAARVHGHDLDNVAQDAPLPKVIYVELADYCNLNCMFCGREAEISETGDAGGFIDIAQIKILEPALRAAEYFGLSGRIGEPLLYPKLPELLQWLYQINPSILLRITTNGTALTAKMAGLLAGHIDFLGISLNAANAAAYARDMRPVGSRSGKDWTPNWNSLVQRLTEFLHALPSEDREKVFVICPAHRDNLDDLPDFVRLAAQIGCKRAVFTPMQVHDEAKIDMSIYWLKDRYNDVVEHACALGTKVGVRVDAARFNQTVKSDLDVGSICRDPVEVAYLNMQKQAKTAPCCHWAEAKLPMDVYRDPEGFNRFWQQETLRKLRAKRDFASCRACGLTRAFDELMFHFTPFLKGKLIDSGNIAETELRNSYPNEELVRTCERIGLDLPSLRRTFLGLGLAPERLEKLKTDGLAALAEFDQVCWRAFSDSNPALSPAKQDLADCFWGIGWGRSEHQPNERVSGRWLWSGRKASIFLRVPLTGTHKILLFAPHQPLNRAAFQLRISEQPLALEFSSSGNHGSLISAEIPSNLPKANRGCLWLQCEFVGDPQSSAAPVLLSKFRIEKVPARERLQRHFNRTVGSISRPIRLAATSCADARSSFERLFEVRRTYWGEVFALLRSDPHEFFQRAKRRLRRD